MSEFQVLKNQLANTRVIETPEVDENIPLQAGELLVRVEKYSYTANNITYGVAGDQLGYWQFFPAQDSAQEGWGIIPVWGFGTVINSGCDGVEKGERLFGYFPSANYLKMSNVNASANKLIDGAEHRAALPPAYNRYRRVNYEPGYRPELDDAMMLLWPLHVTSFSLWDKLVMHDYFGAKQVLVLSASSKTSLGLGFALKEDDKAPKSIGVTSQGNKEWVESVELYNEVLSYQQVNQLDNVETAIVDMSGNAGLLNEIQAHLGENLKFCLNVGLTHWDEMGAKVDIPKDRKEFFFAPGHIQERIKQWGPEEFDKRSTGFLAKSTANSQHWMKVRTIDGLSALKETYPDIANGKVPPQDGIIVKM